MNYELNLIKELPYIKSSIQLFTHLKSSAKIIYISNDDNNKVFCIGFKTPPFDSTGVFHIIEHSVLSGSEKYRLKEPFKELSKGSLYTFLNAMTYKDKTVYPIASKNDDEFFNLMDVYSDAVFFPLIHERKNIFLQEAHRIEVSQSDKLSFSGVVLNEMKGMFSVPEYILLSNTYANLFPDTQYKLDSGGNPNFIIDLTYENFLATYKKYYHPSNAVLYLYGNCDIDECLSLINNRYLSKFDSNITNNIEIKEQSDVSSKSTVFYPCSSKSKDNNYLSLSFVVDKFTNYQLILSFHLLDHILFGTNTAPLKSCLLNYGFGKDISTFFGENMLQPVYNVIAKNSSSENIDEFHKVIYNKLNDLVINKIEPDIIEAAINKWELILLEEDYGRMPRGLVYGLSAMSSVFYSDFSFHGLQKLKLLQNIKNEINSGKNYFEDIIKKYLLHNKHITCIKMIPEEKNVMYDPKVPFLAECEKEQVRQENLSLANFQNTPDPPEVLNQIPLISIGSIDKLPEYISPLRIIENDYTILSNNIETEGIIYLELLFDSSSVAPELLPYVGLLTSVLGNVNTKNYDTKTIHGLINKNTGKLTFCNDTFIQLDKNTNMVHQTDDIYKPKFIVKTKFMAKNTNEVLDIINEILLNTKFNDTTAIKNLIHQTYANMKSKFAMNGDNIAISHCLSSFSQAYKYNETVSGVDFYDFICSLESDIDTRPDKIDEIAHNLSLAYNFLVNKSNLTISITSSNDSFYTFYNNLNTLFNNMRSSCDRHYVYLFNPRFCKEGIVAPIKVQYNACGSNFIKKGFIYSGKLLVLKTLINDYLWDNVRAKGGAYGCGSSFMRSGNMYFFSYRDPNLIETYTTYNNVYRHINDNLTDRQLHKYIIGSINSLDKPKSNALKNEIAATRFLTGVSYEDLKIEREEVLSTSLSDIRDFYKMLHESVTNEYICSVGSVEKIEEHKSLFDKINYII